MELSERRRASTCDFLPDLIACTRAIEGCDASSGFDCLLGTFSGSLVSRERSACENSKITFEDWGTESLEV